MQDWPGKAVLKFMTQLFHREVYLPPEVLNMAAVTVHLKPTRHAIEAARSDRYGSINMPSAITFCGKDVIEIETEDNKVNKLVVRLSYDATRDVVYVFLTDGTLKTLWVNLKTDKHSSLKRHLYTLAPI